MAKGLAAATGTGKEGGKEGSGEGGGYGCGIDNGLSSKKNYKLLKVRLAHSTVVRKVAAER